MGSLFRFALLHSWEAFIKWQYELMVTAFQTAFPGENQLQHKNRVKGAPAKFISVVWNPKPEVCYV